MILSKHFSIDTNSAWVKKHNAEVREVTDAFNRDNPVRVPLFCYEWSGQHGFYADEIKLDYRDYYKNPDLMVEVQLESARRRRELPIYDMILGEAPERWSVSVDFWPVVAAGWFGCKILYSRDAVAANHGLGLSKAECDKLEMPDPVCGGILENSFRFWNHMRNQYESDFTYLGKPVKVNHGVAANGFFSLALDLRGQDIMSDMYEDPEFAHRFLKKVARWCSTLNHTWADLSKEKHEPFPITDHGIDMLSPGLYEEFIVPIIIDMNKGGVEKPYRLHHCGRGIHLFPTMRKYFNITSVDAVTHPLLNIAEVRAIFGEEVWITALIDNSIVWGGPSERIRQTVKDLMSSGVKGKGRFGLMVGDLMRETNMENQIVLYESIKEYGKY